MCLLHFISENNEYGYEMIKRIHKAFPDTKESVVYAAIRTLLKEGYIEATEKKTEGGPPRRYYCLTESGTIKLAKLLKTWRNLVRELADMGIC